MTATTLEINSTEDTVNAKIKQQHNSILMQIIFGYISVSHGNVMKMQTCTQVSTHLYQCLTGLLDRLVKALLSFSEM